MQDDDTPAASAAQRSHQEGPEDICDYLIDDDRSGPPFSLIFGSEKLKSKQGRAWRRAGYHAWLAKAGFADVSFQPTPSPATLVFAR